MRIPRRRPPAVPFTDLSGKVAVVTGASSGIGVETARGLFERGAHVWIIGRNPERTRAVLAQIRSGSGNGNADMMLADFAALSEVSRLAECLLDRLDQLDLLVNNAGIWSPERKLSHEGYELTFAVNHLAPFLLTRRLLPLIRTSEPARVVNVSSRLHIKPKALDFDLPLKKADPRYSGLRAYHQSKLANMLFSAELARRLEGTRTTSNAVHPGDVATNVVRDSAFLSWGKEHLVGQFLLTPEEGARTTLYAATMPHLSHVSGAYFAWCKEARQSPAARDLAAARKLWQLSERLTQNFHDGA